MISCPTNLLEHEMVPVDNLVLVLPFLVLGLYLREGSRQQRQQVWGKIFLFTTASDVSFVQSSNPQPHPQPSVWSAM